ncbi:sulfite exporter TauE/SafE family protein [Ferrimonas gelatinilytica]|uniref:Probable membrane transporter protein n=1 Tax=Ferrimonas gelatinilytica TaxID=1255257 RepID=A0ABP9S3N4_9GAMM
MLTLLLYLVLGAVAGVLSGLFGIGGGLVIVPVLITTFGVLKMPGEIAVHMAIGTSLATIVVTSLSAIYNHNRRGNVDWSVVKRLVPGVLIGAYIGGFLADRFPAQLLENLLAIFLIAVALQMLFGVKPHPDRRLPGPAGIFASGGVIGTLSALFGIGGATLSVPYLRWCSLAMNKAVGTSATLALPVALGGVTSYIINGWDNLALPEWTLGYVYLPAFFGIVVASTQFVRFGAALGAKLSTVILQRSFALFLLCLGGRLLLT